MTPSFAINPLQWSATADGGLDGSVAPERNELLRRIAASGFSATTAAIGVDTDVESYRAELADAGLQSAPGYFGFDVTTDDLGPVLDQVRRLAPKHRALELTEIYLAAGMTAERMARPARGVGFDPDRLQVIIANTERVAAEFVDQGLRPCFHQHVGSWVETESELRALLDNISSEVLFLGPDTGHLAWSGADPLTVVSDYADRVLTLHLKDLHLDRRDHDGDYATVVTAGIFTEPGRGDLDNAAVLAALGNAFDGWAIIEVDRPDDVSPDESARLSAQWVASRG